LPVQRWAVWPVWVNSRSVNNMAVQIGFSSGQFQHVQRQLNRLPGLLATRVYGAGFVVVARQTGQIARRNHPYKDRTGTLTKSFRARKQRSIHGGRKVRGSAAQTYSRRAPHAGLVQIGHGPPVGPRGSRPYPTVVPVVINNRDRLARVGINAMQTEFVKLERQFIAGTLSRDALRLARA